MPDMYSKSVLILGDSTSMSIGLEKKTYPFLLAKAPIWPEGTRIINCSLPGITSADAAAFFFSCRGSWFRSLTAVIVYLGNCDTASSEIRKGKYGHLRQAAFRARLVTGRAPTKTRLKNQLLHYEWNNAYDAAIESLENPSHFEYNIGRVIQACHNASIPVILVRPKANRYFPPGVGKGNFVFYRHLGLKEKLSQHISIPDDRFKEALRLHESEQFEQAAAAYRDIMLQPPKVLMSKEYPLLVLNNYAAARAESGASEEAGYIFQLLLKERGVRREIVLFNLAQIQKTGGRKEEYERLMADSYESDQSLYRIRSPYVQALDRLAVRHIQVRIVDMATLIPDELYLDYCHPRPEGQIRMANEMCRQIGEIGIAGNQAADLENILYNPELAMGNVMEFHEYFKTFAPLKENQIAEAIGALGESLKRREVSDSAVQARSSMPRAIRKAVDYYLRHPYFTSVHDVVRHPPRYPSDVGRFPEYFLVRLLIPYLQEHESNSALSGRFDPALELLRTSHQLLSILPAGCVSLVDLGLPQFDMAYEEARLPLLLGKVRKLLLQHLQAGNQVFERTKTTIFWYVREALRFGTHSRVSMLYDRLLMEFLAEGLAVAGVLDGKMGLKRVAEIEGLIHLLQSAVRIHEEHCSRFSLARDAGPLLLSYDRQLAGIASQIAVSDSKSL